MRNPELLAQEITVLQEISAAAVHQKDVSA